MALVETYPRVELTPDMPLPGSKEHLEFLAALEIPEGSHLSDPHAFLVETNAVLSLARFIHRHRTERPLAMQQRIDSDTRVMGFNSDVYGYFRGTIDLTEFAHIDEIETGEKDEAGEPVIKKEKRVYNRRQLFMHFEPGQDEDGENEFGSYDIAIPITKDYRHDTSRGMEVLALRGVPSSPEYKAWGYNEWSEDAKGRVNDPRVVIYAVQKAAHQLLETFYPIGQPKLEPAPEAIAAWHPEYLSDDPNEFMPRPSVWKRAVEKVRAFRQRKRQDHLLDDPNEFIEGLLEAA